MKLCHSVDGMASDYGEVGHPDMFGVRLLYDADLRDGLVVHGEVGDCMPDEPGVDLIDYLHVPGQDLLHHGDGPLLKCLRHEGVVCITHALLGDVPCCVPVKSLLVKEDPHELHDCD